MYIRKSKRMAFFFKKSLSLLHMSQKNSNFVPEIVKWVVVCAYHRSMSGRRRARNKIPQKKKITRTRKLAYIRKKAVSLHAECVQRKDTKIQKNSAIWQI